MARIGIEHQWILDIEDFTPDEILQFYSFEDSGLELPLANLIFKSKDREKVAEYTKPGKKIRTAILKEESDESIVAEWEVQRKEGADGPMGGGNWGMKLWMTLDNTTYLNTQRFESYDNGGNGYKSSEVLEKVCQQDNLVPDAKTTDDKMVWIQYGITNRQLLEYLTFHGWYAENDPLFTAIYQSGTFIYKPISELKNNQRGLIGNSNECKYRANTINFVQEDGFFSNAIGSSRQIGQHSSEHGVGFRDSTQVHSQSMGTGFKEGTSRNSVFEHLNDNVHRNWWPALNQNRQGRSSISALVVSFVLSKIHADLKPLDFVEVDWRSQTGEEGGEANQAFAGKWMVLKSEYFIDHLKGTAYQIVNIGREELVTGS